MIVCTMSWWRHDTSYGVIFNRDESRLRSEAQIPSRFELSGVSYLSPVDPEGGGTWIWVNANGVIGCLLNNYNVLKSVPADPVSRGLLLKSLASCKDSESLCRSVSAAILENYRGFSIFAMDRHHHCMVVWNGDKLLLLAQQDVHIPLSSSGFMPEEIISYRTELYRSRFGSSSNPEPEDLLSYHFFHDPELPAHSVLMSRPDARTVSVSQISVEAKSINFSYRAVSERCRLRPHTSCSLNRVD